LGKINAGNPFSSLFFPYDAATAAAAAATVAASLLALVDTIVSYHHLEFICVLVGVPYYLC